MGNLRKHAQQCWGEEILIGADACGDIDSTREGLSKAKKLTDGSITTAFARKRERNSYLFSLSTQQDQN
jgi:hypothetical protein